MVWSPESTGRSVSDIRKLPLDTPSGRADTARHRRRRRTVGPNPNVIERQDDSRYLDVDASVAGRDLGSVVKDISGRLGSLRLARGYHFEILGEYQERQAAQRRLLESSIIAAVLILLLLEASFRRWRLAVLAFLTLPMALVGGALAVWGTGGVISLGALVGFFTVFGIAASNGILLINHCQHLEDRGGRDFGPALVLRGRPRAARRRS